MRRSTFVLGLSLFSCAEPSVTPVIAPDGAPALFVACGSDEAQCYRLAGERCPQGYELGRSARGNGLLVRCRMAWAAPPAATPMAPIPVVATVPPTPPVTTPPPVQSAPVSTFPPAGSGKAPADPVGY